MSGNSIAPSNEQGISRPGMSAGLIPGLLSNFNTLAITRLLYPDPTGAVVTNAYISAPLMLFSARVSQLDVFSCQQGRNIPQP